MRPAEVFVRVAVARGGGPLEAALDARQAKATRIRAATVASASSQPIRSHAGSPSPFGAVRRSGCSTRSECLTIAGAALPFTHSARPVGWPRSDSNAVKRPSTVTAVAPQRETHSAQNVGVRTCAWHGMQHQRAHRCFLRTQERGGRGIARRCTTPHRPQRASAEIQLRCPLPVQRMILRTAGSPSLIASSRHVRDLSFPDVRP